jgi:hypothetical protein
MNNKVKIMVLVSFIIALGVSSINLGKNIYYEYNQKIDAPAIACWWYGAYDHTPEDIVFMCERFHINKLFISLSTSNALENQTLAIIRECQKNSIEIHWMTLEAADFVFESNHNQALSYITDILDFLENYSITIEGIHLDAEPPIFWNDSSVDSKTFNEALGLWNKIQIVLDQRLGENRRLQLSSAICDCYHTLDGYLTNGTAMKMHQYLDFLVPMTYHFVSVQQYINNLDPLLVQAPLMFGICPEAFQTTENMESLIQKVSYYYRENPNYQGFAIFNNRILARLIDYEQIKGEEAADILMNEPKYNWDIITPIIIQVCSFLSTIVIVKKIKASKKNKQIRIS